MNLDKENFERATKFFEVYELQKEFNADLEKRTFIGNRKNRVCRFCGETNQTKFKKLAHLIPQSIGNRYLLSSFECDDCNGFFGEKYENHFANFFGMTRPFAKIRNDNKKKKDVKFRDAKSGLEVVSSRGGVEIYFNEKNKDAVTINEKEKTLKVIATHQPYVPIHVYRMFLKMGLSLIDDNELKYFTKAFRFLKNQTQDEKLINYPMCRMFLNFIPGPTTWNKPTISLFKKKDSKINEAFPSKCLVLYFGNRIYQMFPLFNSQDDHLLGKDVTLRFFPILIHFEYFQQFGLYTTTVQDLSSTQKVTDQEINLSFTFERVDFNINSEPSKA